jgi:hypothetical protein
VLVSAQVGCLCLNKLQFANTYANARSPRRPTDG